MLTYVFPGQGSQYKGMGKELFDDFKELTDIASEILGYSIKDLCLKDPNNLLSQTQYTQPAMYVVNTMCYYASLSDNNKKPDYLAGHSLGEYNALLAANVYSFEEGLHLVKKRGQLMHEVTEGGMAAVIGLEKGKIEHIIETYQLTQLDIANYNTPKQTVLSGPKEDLVRAQPLFIDAGAIQYTLLKVSGAFHSRYMDKAREVFKDFVETCTFSKPSIPVIANRTARPYTVEDIKGNIIFQMTQPVRWTETVTLLLEICPHMEFTQIGPGRVLTNLIRRVKKETQISAINV